MNEADGRYEEWCTEQRLAASLKLKRDSTPPQSGAPASAPGDWPEDFSHENGNYLNRCVECDLQFVGHKRRVICKLCATPAPPSASGDTIAAPSTNFVRVCECVTYPRVMQQINPECPTHGTPQPTTLTVSGNFADEPRVVLHPEAPQPAAPISESEPMDERLARINTTRIANGLDPIDFDAPIELIPVQQLSESETPPQEDIEKMLDEFDEAVSEAEGLFNQRMSDPHVTNRAVAARRAILDSFSRLTRDLEDTEEARVLYKKAYFASIETERALRAEVSRLREQLEKADDFSNCQESELRRLRETALTPEEAAHLLSELPDLTHHIADPFITKLRATLDKLRSLAAASPESKNG